MALTEEEKRKKAQATFERNQELLKSAKKSGTTEPKMSKEEAQKSVKEQNKKVAKDAKEEKKIMAGRTDSALYKNETKSEPEKATNKVSGKAQQFSYVTDKPTSFSAKVISSEAENDYNKLPISPIQRGKQTVGENIARLAGVEQETLDDIKAKAIPKFGKDVFSESVDSGVANYISNLTGSLGKVYELSPSGFVANSLNKAIYGETRNPFETINEPLQKWQEKEELEAQKAAENTGKGKSAENASRLITMATEMAPSVLLSFVPGGQAGSVANAASTLGKAKGGFKALTSAKTFFPTLQQMTLSTIKDPVFWNSFGQILYPEYEEAVAKGASEGEATATALLSAFGQSALEKNFGIEKLPKAGAQTVKQAVFDFVKSAVEEGNEEVIQSVISGITQKLIFDHDQKLVSTSPEEDAVLNMANAFDEWIMAVAASGVMGIPGALVNAGNIKTEANTNAFVEPAAEPPVSPAEAPIVEAENVTPETANKQEGAFANAEEKVEAEKENNVEKAPEETLKILKEQFDKGEISKEEYLAKNYENLSKYFEERKNANAQVNSTNDVIEQVNAQPRAQENIPQETATPKSKTVVDPESEMEYVSEEDYDGAQTNGNFGKNTVGSAQLNNTFYKSLDEFGAQPLRKEQIANGNEMRVPKKISENEAITENVGYMLGSKLADNDYMDDVIQHPEKYAHIINTDANSMQNAIDYIQNNGLDETYGAWRKTIDEHKMVEKDDISKAYLLGLFYQNKAKSETDPAKKEEYRHRALDIKTDINYAASKGGQLLQGIQMLQKAVDLDSINLKEDGEYMANRLVEKLNADRNGKGKEIVLNKKLVDKAIEAAGTDAEGKAWDEVYKDLANQTSTSFWQRVNNYRYWCMLSNPRTHVRNIMSNVSMAIVNAVKDATAKPIVEGLFNAYAKNRSNKAVELDSKIKQLIVDQKKTGAKDNSAEIEKLKKRAERLHGFDNAQKKTVAFYSPKNLKFAFDDFKTAKLIFDKSAGKYQENTNSFIKEHKTNQNSLIEDRLAKKIEGNTKAGKAVKTILEHGVFGSVMDFNSWLLTDVEDGSFKAITYAHELLQRMSANGITPETASRPENIKKMDELRADAFAEALYNTFNEDSKTADALRKPEETGVIPHVVVESLLPFKKVPVNIIKTGRDYSPIGVAKGIGEMAKVLRDPKAGDPGKAINDIAKGLTGLELMALGGFLRSIGKITNGLSDDENEKNYQKLLGEQAFAIKFDDGSSYTIDWLGAPVMPLFVGALIQDMKEGKLKEKIDFKKEDGSFDLEEAISVFGGGAVGVLSSIANPMIEMSMLQNIEYTLTSQYNSLGDFATDAFGNYANQFVPQVLAAITKVKDNTKRNAYYVDKTDKMSDVFQVPVQVAMSKIPGVAEKLPEKVDAWGRTQTHSDRDTQLGWAFDAFISPGTYKKDKTTQADRFLLSAFDGDASVMPKMQQKYFNIEKQRKDLSAQEYVDLQKEYGKQAQTLINQLIPNKATFNKLPDELQYKVIDDVYSYASQKGKEKVTLGEARRYVADKWVSEAEKYAKEDGKPITQTIMERKVIGQYTTKDEQMAALQKTFGLSGDELHENFYKAKGEWNDNIQDVIAGGTSREAKVDAFKKRKWSDEEIVAGYNGLKGYGDAKKAEQIAILTKVFGSKAKATEFYNIKEGNKGYK